jgi:hypothetical protein
MVLGCTGGCWFTVALMKVLMNSVAFSLDESCPTTYMGYRGRWNREYGNWVG